MLEQRQTDCRRKGRAVEGRRSRRAADDRVPFRFGRPGGESTSVFAGLGFPRFDEEQWREITRLAREVHAAGLAACRAMEAELARRKAVAGQDEVDDVENGRAEVSVDVAKCQANAACGGARQRA